MVLYAAAVFVSAFLLFQVQPVLGKFILPRYGGGAAVWTACLLFFQVTLLCGYAWAHGLRRWLPERHRRVHVAFLAVTLFSIPIIPPVHEWTLAADAPGLSIVLLLAVTVGLPYMALAATGPLLQSWFADRFPGRSPYRLYALSNVGSLLGLLTYPFLVEPNMTRDGQVISWSVVYLGLVGLLALAAFGGPRRARDESRAVAELSVVTPTTLLQWLLFAACGSALLMAVTNHMSQEVAVVPFLWVLPLSLYLLSFIITFDSDRWYDRRVFGALLAVFVPAALWALGKGLELDFRVGILIWSGLLFTLCTCCHGELVRRRPPSDRLTLFYLAVSAGGALGGLFVGVAAPLVFNGYWELHIAIGLSTALVLDDWLRGTREWAPARRQVVVGTALVAQLIMGVVLVRDINAFGEDVVSSSRNFFGVLRVVHTEDDTLGETLRLYHGQTKHGFQYADRFRRREVTAYYAPHSGAGVALQSHPRRNDGPLSIGVVGLGVGTLAAYGLPGDRIRFWELDPAVEDIARSDFTYLEDSLAEVDVVLGDARLRMTDDLLPGGRRYDVLAIDAFSSDAIPIHLLTAEASELYWRLLAPDGLLVFHVSNRFVELEPVVRALAGRMQARIGRFTTERSRRRGVDRTTWLVVAKPDNPFFEDPRVSRLMEAPDDDVPPVLWTDDFASLWPVLDLR